MTHVRILRSDEAHVLTNVSPEVFDNPIHPEWCAEFFADPRHHLAVALDGDLVVGMASGVHYLHPDKAPQLFINEVAVASTHAGKGLGRTLVTTLVEHGRTVGANEAWVLTSPTNEAAKRMYRAAGAISEEELNVMFTYLTPGMHRET